MLMLKVKKQSIKSWQGNCIRWASEQNFWNWGFRASMFRELAKKAE